MRIEKGEEWVMWNDYRGVDVRTLLRILPNLRAIHMEDVGVFSRDGIIYSRGDGYGSVVLCPPDHPARRIVIDASVQCVRPYAFFGAKNITDVQAEGSVKIMDNAFQSAVNLKSVTLKGTRNQICENAFHNCRSLETLHVPAENIISCSCSGMPDTPLRKLRTDWIRVSGYSGDPETIKMIGRRGENVWTYCDSSDTEYVFGSGPLWNYGDYEYPHNRDLIIGKNITSVSDSAFEQCSYRSVSFEECVKEIEDGAFVFGNIDSIEFPETIEHIGVGITENDPCHVDSIIIAASIKKIDPAAFSWRYWGPDSIFLTGDTPPKDWIMWMRSEIFREYYFENTGKVYYPKGWKNVMTPEYFEAQREIVKRVGVPEEFRQTAFDCDVDDRLGLLGRMEADICGTGEAEDQREEAVWIPYDPVLFEKGIF